MKRLVVYTFALISLLILCSCHSLSEKAINNCETVQELLDVMSYIDSNPEKGYVPNGFEMSIFGDYWKKNVNSNSDYYLTRLCELFINEIKDAKSLDEAEYLYSHVSNCMKTQKQIGFWAEVKKDQVFVSKVDALFLDEVATCTSFSGLIALANRISEFDNSILGNGSFVAKVDELFLKEVATCPSLSDLNSLASTVSKYDQTILNDVVFVAKVDSLFLKEIDSSSSLSDFISLAKTVSKYDKSVLGSEAVILKRDQLIDSSVSSSKTLSELTSLERIVLSEFKSDIKEYASYPDSLRSVVKNDLSKDISLYANESAYIDGITGYSEASLILDDYNLLVETIETIRSSSSLPELRRNYANYTGNKKTVIFDERVESLYTAQEKLFEEQKNELAAFNSIESRIKRNESPEQIVDAILDYNVNYGKNSKAYNETHYNTLSDEYGHYSAIAYWKKSAKYNAIFQNVSEEIPILPVYFGHRGEAYEPTGMTLKEFLGAQDFSNWTIIFQENNGWFSSNYKLDFRYTESTILYSVDVRYSFTLEKQQEKLVIVDVSYPDDFVYSSEDYTTIKKYYTYLVSGNGLVPAGMSLLYNSFFW